MSVIDQAVAGAAVATVITADMSPTVPGAGQTMTVNDATGYPAVGRFTIVIDRGNPNEEKVLITSRSGTTFTIAQRGYDGTTANTHTSGQSAVEHALAAAVVAALINHVDDGEADPHSTKLLNNARHDIEARHQFGSGLAFGLPVTPTALTPDIAGAAGTGNNPAREDHAHNIPAATAGLITNVAAEGVAATFARSDHNHTIDSDPPIALTLTESNTEGSGVPARANHGHSTAALPWGLLASQILTTTGTAFSVDSTTDFTLTPTVSATRNYRVVLHSQVVLSALGIWNINFHVGGVLTGRIHAIDFDTGGRDFVNAEFLWQPASGSPTVDIRVAETLGSATIQFEGAADNPRQFWIEDIGPR